MTYDEEAVFARGANEGARWSRGDGTQLAICAELVRLAINRGRPNDMLIPAHRSNALDHGTGSLLVSSCWAVPLASGLEVRYAPYVPPDEQRYGGQLEKVVSLIFQAYPDLQAVIMTDRKPEGGTVEPYNAHFRRV